MKMPDFKKTALGIELGSTRIKSVLVDADGSVIAQGSHTWENRLENGLWTYSLEDIEKGIQSCYASLKADVKAKYGCVLYAVGCIGISAMMHGYMAFDRSWNLLVPFRTWRNNNAERAADKLTKMFDYPIPARWSIAHLMCAIDNAEEHTSKIAFQTTLAGYVHKMLTGEHTVGIGEASGIFPIDTAKKNYDEAMVAAFDRYLSDKKLPYKLEDILPKVRLAGESAGTLTESGAKFLDPDGDLVAGIAFCPPEGDAGTGMVATESIDIGTGNISAGTSVFGMVVLDKNLSSVHREIDLVTTPVGDTVAMVHCNNCSSEINAWMGIFKDILRAVGCKTSEKELFARLFEESLEGDGDCGGVVACNYLSGENITQIEKGMPMFVHGAKSKFTLANFVRSQIYSCFVTLKTGLDILTEAENVKIDKLYAHGGLFKTEGVAQRYLAAATRAPIAVMENAGEGGAWGMAVLAAFAMSGQKSLSDFLHSRVFAGVKERTVIPDESEAVGFDAYAAKFKKLLPAERAAAVLEE